MLETELYSLLSTTTLLTGTISTRVYPVKAPQNVSEPYLIYTRISGGQVSGLDGYLTMENPRIQIDAYSKGYSQVKTIADNVHSAMNGATAFKAILISDNDLFEEDFDLYRVSMDFSVWNRD
jgi:hypothetical protein